MKRGQILSTKTEEKGAVGANCSSWEALHLPVTFVKSLMWIYPLKKEVYVLSQSNILNRNCATSPNGMQIKPIVMRFVSGTNDSIKTLSLHPKFHSLPCNISPAKQQSKTSRAHHRQHDPGTIITAFISCSVQGAWKRYFVKMRGLCSLP